jgi:chromosome segregation ATPase
MFRFLRLLWYKWTGQMDRYAELMATDRNVIAAVYDNAIEKTAQGTNDLVDAITELVDVRDTIEGEVKKAEAKIAHWEKVKVGSAAAAKKRAAAIVAAQKALGVEDQDAIKAAINGDAEYLKANGAFNDATSSLKEIEGNAARFRHEVQTKDKALLVYKRKLQDFQRSKSDLQEKKATTVAEVAIAKRLNSLNQRLAGIAETVEDKDLQMVEAARRRIVSKSNVLTELAGTDAQSVDKEYAAYAESVKTNAELEQMLDLDNLISGGKAVAEKTPAKLPE